MKVMRYMLREFYGIPSTETGGTVAYHYINPGFTQLNEEGGAQTENEAYIGDKNATPSVTGYENTWAFECQYIHGDPVCEDIRDIAKLQKVGSECERELVSIDMNEPVGEGGTTFKARHFKIAVEAAPPQGEPRAVTTMSGNFHQQGDMEIGTFDTSTRTFTAETAEN